MIYVKQLHETTKDILKDIATEEEIKQAIKHADEMFNCSKCEAIK